MVIFSKTYIVQEVTCENSTAIIIKSCDSADKLFTQKIPDKNRGNPGNGGPKLFYYVFCKERRSQVILMSF